MVEIQLSADADQQFDLTLEGQFVVMRVRWNRISNRWHMDLVIDGEVVLVGRRIVLNTDLVEPFDFGIGRIFAVAEVENAEPTFDAFANRSVRLYQANDADLIAAGLTP